jgi:hypothetical protein
MSSMPEKRWVYTLEVQAAFYQQDDVIYSSTGEALYHFRDEWWREVKDGTARYWVRDNVVYTTEGAPVFWYG